MHVQFWVEEPSMEAFLNGLLPSIIESPNRFEIFNFGDKATLLSEAPGRLKSLANWMPQDWRIVILVDEDRQDCVTLKARLEGAARQAGLNTLSTNPNNFQVINRIVVEELEAWIFGDPQALCAAFPRVSLNIGKKSRYRHPDAITGGTWESLERELQKAGYFKAGIPKRQVASRVASHIAPSRNRSHSFQVFWTAIVDLVSEA